MGAGVAGAAGVGAWAAGLLRTPIGMTQGFGEGLINRLNGSVPLWPHTCRGDIWEPRGASQVRGYDIAQTLLRWTHLAHDAPRPWEQARGQPLLATARLTVPSADGPHAAHVRFDALPDPHNDWSHADRASAVVDVFVDGHYASTMDVPTERTEGYDVNLGTLAPGSHEVQIRDARAITPEHARAARISDARGYVTGGEQALIDVNEPVLETRDVEQAGGVRDLAWNDSPLLTAATVTHDADGGQTIHYQTLFSNEDGGTPWRQELTDYGRSSDYEELYRVRLNAAGDVMARTYEGPAHHRHRFEGALVDGRPLLRVSTGNNNASDQGWGDAPLWSPGTGGPSADAATGASLMLAHPWTFRLAAREELRDHAGSPPRTADERDFLFFSGAATQVQRSLATDPSVTLRLTSGATRTVELPWSPADDAYGMSVPLPAGVRGQDVAAISTPDEPPGLQLFVLDDDLHPRVLTNTGEPTR
jgi:hypothetical protein